VNRRASFAALGASAAVVIGCALFLFVGIAAGVWQPRGAPPPRASVGPPGGIPVGARSYSEFLDDVRSGDVLHASQQGQLVQVDAVDGSYTVEAPPNEDVYADMTAAAESAGVDVPAFDTDQLNTITVSYDDLLAEVEAGHIHDVSQQGVDIHATSSSREYVTTAPSETTDVLADIEAAADRGGVTPPYYAKLPPGG
jgi:hypothetical protein